MRHVINAELGPLATPILATKSRLNIESETFLLLEDTRLLNSFDDLPPKKPPGDDDSKNGKPKSILDTIKNVLFGNKSEQKAAPKEQPQERPPVEEKPVATFEPIVVRYTYDAPETSSERYRRRGLLGSKKSSTGHGGSGSDSRKSIYHLYWNAQGEIIFDKNHAETFLKPHYPPFLAEHSHRKQRKMKSYVQVLTTPTADTPGTTLILHFENKRYLVGSLAEGTQRACVQMGARLLKVSECFLTGRTEWKNTGGLIGMILTLADSSASSQVSSQEEALKKARSKAHKLGISDDPEKMRQLEEEAKKQATNTLKVFGPPNLNHTLATARRYVFRKGMPVNVHEIRDGKPPAVGTDDQWAPFWADESMKVWAMSISPTRTGSSSSRSATSASPRKRSIDEVDATENGAQPTAMDDLTAEERNYLTVKAVVSEMFNSSWRLDTLYETALEDVQMPATIFVRNLETNKIENYTGPTPGGKRPMTDPRKTVLVRRPWPGALVESLPPVTPAKEAVSYIFRNHMQRGKFHPQRAQELKVPKGRAWAQLTNGESVQNSDGETITPEMVLDPPRVGGGIAVVDLPGPEYIDNLINRPEWREHKVMEGVGAIVWICGKDVATDSRLHAFMQEFVSLEHIVSSPDYCPNNIALDSVAAATIRLKQVDPERYGVPVHDAETADGAQAYGGNAEFQKVRASRPLPGKVHIAARGQTIELEPAIKFQTRDVVSALKVPETAAEVAQDVLEEAAKAQEAIKIPNEDIDSWRKSLPTGAQDAEVITLGTGSALPSKYRNVSSTLVRVPGWGNIMLDCGENTLGQLKRVFTAAELKDVLQNLKLIFISHMHADHQLGTTSVVKAWYEEVHGSQPAPPLSVGDGMDVEARFKDRDRLAIISEPAMQHWLAEYSAVEDYGYSRIAPLYISPGNPAKDVRSKLGWYIDPIELRDLSSSAWASRMDENYVSSSRIGLEDIQCVLVKHCHGARAVSITLPSGFKVSYSGDCRPSQNFSRIGRGSTVCIHEATFDDELAGDARAKNHSTTSEALGVAQGMGAKACVLTHFSQRYQKVPVLERAEGQPPAVEDVPMTNGAITPPSDEDTGGIDNEAPIDDAAATFPDQETGSGQQYDLPSKKAAAPEAIKFKLQSDMKVCVAFDYMRVKVGDVGLLEEFTPALLKLFAEEYQEKGVETSPKNGKGKGQQKQGKGKGRRNN